MSDCRFGVSPVNYPDPDPDPDAPSYVKVTKLLISVLTTVCLSACLTAMLH